MARWRVHGKISAGKYIGIVEADTKEEAEEKGWQLEGCSVSVCHQCSDDVEDPEIYDLIVENMDDVRLTERAGSDGAA